MKIADDTVVTVDYSMTDADDGTVLETTEEQSLVYLHGHENVLPGLEKELTGKSAGEKFSVKLKAEDAFGEFDKELISTVRREEFDPGEIEVGAMFQTFDETGNPMVVVVTEVDDEKFVVDGNHPLAGKSVKFEGEIKEVREATEEEISHGHIHGEGCDHHHHEHDHNGCCDHEH